MSSDMQVNYFKYPLKYRIKGIEAENYDLRLPQVKVSDEGTKILVVIDRPPNEDLRTKRLMRGDYGSVFRGCIEYAQEHCDGKLKELACINYQEFNTTEIKGSLKSKCDKIFLKRVLNFAEKYKPDIILFMGEKCYMKMTKHSWEEWQLRLGRIQNFKYKGKVYRAISTLSIIDIATDRVQFLSSHPNLAGIVCRNIATAIENKNRYTIDVKESKKILIKTMPAFKAFMKELWKAKYPCFDVEAANLNRIANTLFTLQCTWDGKTAYLVPLYHKDTPFNPEELDYIVKELRNYFENNTAKYHVYHTAKYDVQQEFTQLKLRWYNAPIYDITGGDYALEENSKFLQDVGFRSIWSLKRMEIQNGYHRKGLTIEKEDRGNMANFSLEDITEYGCIDVLTCWQIHRFQVLEARRRGPDYDMFIPCVTQVIGSIIFCFVSMEHNGLLVDRKYLMKMQAKDSIFEKTLKEVNDKFKKSKAARSTNKVLLDSRGVPRQGIFGDSNQWVFDINTSETQQTLFFEVLELEPLEERKDKGFKLDKHFQKEYASVPEVKLLDRFNKIKKAKSTFIVGIWKRLIKDPDAQLDSRLRAFYNFLKVITGRYSAEKPGYHQIPSRAELSKAIKRQFIAPPRKIFVKADFAAHEVLGLCNISGDEAMASTFKLARNIKHKFRLAKGKELVAKLGAELGTKGDIHIINVKFFFNKDVDKEHPLRYAIKQVVFGVIYGKGANALADDIKQSAEYAKDLIKKLFSKWKQAGAWIKRVQSVGRSTLIASSPVGRVRHLWGHLHYDNSVKARMDRRGPNSVIQGYASDLGAIASHLFISFKWFFLEKNKLRSGIQHDNSVHDSCENECNLEELPLALYFLEHAMTTQLTKKCRETFNHNMLAPLDIDVEIGGSLGSMSKWDMRYDTILGIAEKQIDWMKAELGYDLDKEKYLKVIEHNTNIIWKYRKKELEEALEFDGAYEGMLITPRNVKDLRLILDIADLKSTKTAKKKQLEAA